MNRPSDERATLTRCARRLNSRTPLLPPMWFMTDRQRTPDPCVAVRHLPREAGVIFRHYDDPERDSLGLRLKRMCHEHGRLFLVAGDAKLAQRLRADGLHLPEHQLLDLSGLRRRHARWIFTASAHTLPAVLSASRLKADALIVAPVLPTESHASVPHLGRIRFAALAHRTTLPVYALGGIDGATAHQLSASGAVGIAAIGAFLQRPSQ